MLTFVMAHPYLTTWMVLAVVWIGGAAVENVKTTRSNELKVRLAELEQKMRERKAGES